MGLKDCLISAVEQKAISREEATFLADEFEERFAQNRLSMGDDVAKAKARKDLEATLRAEAIEKKRRADLTEARRLGIKSYLQGYRDRQGRANVYEGAMALLSHYGYRGTSSVRGKTEAIIAGAHKNLDQVMFTFQRKGLFGQRQNRAMVSDVVRELHGEASGDATAKGLARSITAVFEDLRQRFNAAGGAIGKLENFGLPHSHDRMKVKAQGREGWKAAIRPLLDPDRMTNPLTGNPVGAAGVDAALDHVYASIVSNNRAHMTPSMGKRGAGALASQRQDERFLTFRDAASWEAYNRQFGRGDVIQAVFNHVNGMARDIASMEMLGPNPASMVEYLKQVTEHEIGKGEAGMASLVPESKLFNQSQAAIAAHRIDSLWQEMRGRGTVLAGWSGTTANIKNLVTSAVLGSTAGLAASTDPAIAASARRLAGLPVTAAVHKIADSFRDASRREIVRAGVIMDEYLHVMHDEIRFAGPALGAEWSRWLADRALTWSGLTPLTNGRKMVEARFWQGHIADMADRSFDQLDPRFRTTLEGFEVTPEIWDIWRNSVDVTDFVTPRQIEQNGGAVTYLDMSAGPLSSPAHQAEATALAHRDAAEKLSEVISSWSERSVPSGTPNARSVVTGRVERGTVLGELADYFFQFKSFGLSFTALQLEAIGEMAATRGGGKGARTGIAYFAGLAVPLMLGGGIWMQIKSLLDGKEPEDMNPMTAPDFWARAMLTGGGLGLFGDFIKASENRFGQSPLEAMAGPGLAFGGDILQYGYGLASLPFGGEFKPGKEARTFAQRYTPVLSSHWATRGAYNRLFLDNLQWLTDPDADKAFKRQASKAAKDGQAFFVKPGQFTPSR